MAISKKQTYFLLIILILVSLVLIGYYNSVDNSLTKEDKKYIPKYIVNIKPLNKNATYKDELKYIISIQHSVLNIISKSMKVAHGKKREPKELYLTKSGLCYDRSRVIEKILRYSGFKTRHIAIYSKEKTGSSFETIITPGIPSHAVSEVLTKKGWLVVDSNAPWVSIDNKKKPISIDMIQKSIENSKEIHWSHEPPFNIYLKPFVYVYGLYSRHGYFYPPYNFIPDINYNEFIQNIKVKF